MDALQVFFTIVVIALVAVAVLFIYQRIKMSRDPEYAAKVSKRMADRDLARQKRKVARAEFKVKKARYKEATAPAKAELNRAKADYNNRVKRAEDALRHANAEHEKAIRDQDKKISDITKRYSRELVAVGSTKLFVDRMEIQGSPIKLEAGFAAEVKRGTELLEAAAYGDFRFAQTPEDGRPSAAGVAVGGIGTPELPWEILARPDFCYLFVGGACSEYAGKPLNICVPLDDKRLDAGEKFAEQLALAAPSAADNERKRDAELAEAHVEKAQIEADTSAIAEAEAALAVERDNNQEVILAQQNLDQAEQKASIELDYRP